jgi:hypothetical protein
MAKLFLSLKPLLIILFGAIPAPLAELTAKILDPQQPPMIVFYICFAWVMAPELVIYFNKDLQMWLKEGFEDADGKLNRDDLKQILPHYFTLWAIRVWVLMTLCYIFFGFKFDTYIYMSPVVIALGTEGAQIFKLLKK